MLFTVIGVLVLAFSPLKAAEENDSLSSKLMQDRHAEVYIQMDDGILLATEVFLPKRKAKGSYPVVLVRTPYNKDAEKWLGKAFGFFGIAVVTQDCRGKYESEGEFYPFVNERLDGLVTLNWIREQEWCNGVISGWGSSYLGYTQLAISDSIDFMTLLLTGSNIYDFAYPDGCFSLQSAFTWGLQNADSITELQPSEKLSKSFSILPVSEADDSVLRDIKFLDDWINHEKYDKYWDEINHRGLIQAPMLSIAGWYDIFLKAQLEDFESSPGKNNSISRLIIGPWCHGSMGIENDFGGTRKTGSPKKIFKYVRKFMKGKKTRLSSPLMNTRYNLFIMERNKYVGSDTWPPAETNLTPHYIGPENYLDTITYTESGALEYQYSPLDPYPSYGGTALGEGVGQALQNENSSRKDQIVCQKYIENDPLILLGPVSAKLWLNSNVSCTDFVVQIQDVFPDGKIVNIQEGISHVKFNGSNPQMTEISIWSTGYQLNPGHSLRVVISSSWFPRFNRSLNNCEPASEAISSQDAIQRLYYGPETPSHLILPVYNME